MRPGGIGRRIASTLAAAGAEVIVSGRSAEALTELVDSLPGSGHSVLAADLGLVGAAQNLPIRPERLTCWSPMRLCPAPVGSPT